MPWLEAQIMCTAHIKPDKRALFCCTISLEHLHFEVAALGKTLFPVIVSFSDESSNALIFLVFLVPAEDAPLISSPAFKCACVATAS